MHFRLTLFFAVIVAFAGCGPSEKPATMTSVRETPAAATIDSDTKFTITTQTYDSKTGQYTVGIVRKNVEPEDVQRSVEELAWDSLDEIPKVKIIRRSSDGVVSYFGIARNRNRENMPLEVTWQSMAPDEKFLRICHEIDSEDTAKSAMLLFLADDPVLESSIPWHEH